MVADDQSPLHAFFDRYPLHALREKLVDALSDLDFSTLSLSEMGYEPGSDAFPASITISGTVNGRPITAALRASDIAGSDTDSLKRACRLFIDRLQREARLPAVDDAG